MTGPQPAIRLRIDGAPQQLADAAALVIQCALGFCAQPETFPVFQAYAVTAHAEHGWVARVMRAVTPGIAADTAQMIAAGVVADFEEANP